MRNKLPKVLYFIAGIVPTEEQMREGLAHHAQFRNAGLVEGPNLEECDFVAGQVPELYAHIPRVDSAEATDFDPTTGELIGDYYLHQVARGVWNVYDDEGGLLNETPMNKADARALALENTED